MEKKEKLFFILDDCTRDAAGILGTAKEVTDPKKLRAIIDQALSRINQTRLEWDL